MLQLRDSAHNQLDALRIFANLELGQLSRLRRINGSANYSRHMALYTNLVRFHMCTESYA